MRIVFVKSFIAIVIAALVGWGLYELCRTSQDALLLAIISGSLLAMSGVGCIGLQLEQKRLGTVIHVTSGVFFFITLIINLLFAIEGLALRD